MRFFSVIRNIGLAAVTLGLGAGLALLVGGCASSPRPDASTDSSGQTGVGSAPALPELDARAPVVYQSAAFGFG